VLPAGPIRPRARGKRGMPPAEKGQSDAIYTCYIWLFRQKEGRDRSAIQPLSMSAPEDDVPDDSGPEEDRR
jgi:hypothetical protein